MADEPVGPVLSQLLLKGPLGSWFQVPQLGRSPVPPFCQLELGNRWRSMTGLPHFSIMMFPTIFSGSESIGGLATSYLPILRDSRASCTNCGLLRYARVNGLGNLNWLSEAMVRLLSQKAK